jgi:hypothetical protein
MLRSPCSSIVKEKVAVLLEIGVGYSTCSTGMAHDQHSLMLGDAERER